MDSQKLWKNNTENEGWARGNKSNDAQDTMGQTTPVWMIKLQ